MSRCGIVDASGRVLLPLLLLQLLAGCGHHRVLGA